MKAMLDANVCIRVLRDRPAHIGPRFKAEAPHVGISTVVLHELLYGAARSDRPDHQLQQVEAFVAHIQLRDFDRAAAEHASDIKAALASRGQIIGPDDLLIAGHARSLGLKLITGNLREFTRVDGLRCEDWLSEEQP